MVHPDSSLDPMTRVRELVDLYGNSGASAAYLLCDRHEPHAIAYRIISEDLSSSTSPTVSCASSRNGSRRGCSHWGFEAATAWQP